jgi:hypothetical protein
VSNVRPDTVEEWAPLFLRSFKKEQILDPQFSLTFNHCKLCDAHVPEGAAAHMKAHKKELTKYLAKREKAAERNRTAGLKNWQREQALEREVAPVGGDDDDF